MEFQSKWCFMKLLLWVVLLFLCTVFDCRGVTSPPQSFFKNHTSFRARAVDLKVCWMQKKHVALKILKWCVSLCVSADFNGSPRASYSIFTLCPINTTVFRRTYMCCSRRIKWKLKSLWTSHLFISSSLVLILCFYWFNFKVGIRNTGITSIPHITCCLDPCYEHVSWYTSNTFLQISLLFRYMTSLSIRSHVLKRITSQSMLVTTLGFSLDTCSLKSLQDVSFMARTPTSCKQAEKFLSKKAQSIETVLSKTVTFWRRIKFINLSTFAKRVTTVTFCVDNPPHIMHQK